VTAALLITAVFLALFGIAFVVLGQVNEKSYWSQRDPSAAPGREGTRLPQVARRTWYYAVQGKRPSLRIMAIGIVLVAAGVVFALLALLAALLSR
jgi:hypothetical protein